MGNAAVLVPPVEPADELPHRPGSQRGGGRPQEGGGDGQAAVQRLRGLNIPIHLVVNRVKPRLLRKLRMDIDDAMDQTGLALLGVVPEDETVTLAAARGVSIITVARKGAALAYYHIAKRITGRRTPLMRI